MTAREMDKQISWFEISGGTVTVSFTDGTQLTLSSDDVRALG